MKIFTMVRIAITLLAVGLMQDATVHAQVSPATRPAARGTRGGAPTATPALAPATTFPAVQPNRPSSAPEGAASAIDATVYEISIPLEKIGSVDIEALTKSAKTAVEFEKALANLGAVRPLYHVDQAVRLASDTITIGTNVPYITNSQISNSGQTINSISYTNIGAIFTVAGTTGSAGTINMDLGIQLSVVSDGGTPISRNVNAPRFRNTTVSHKGPIQPGEPFVAISIDGGSRETGGKGVAYIVRVTFGEPKGN